MGLEKKKLVSIAIRFKQILEQFIVSNGFELAYFNSRFVSILFTTPT